MKLTKELLDEFSACKAGVDLGLATMDYGVDSKVAIQEFDAIGNVEFANWVRRIEINPHAIKFSGEYEYLRFLVYNPKENKYLAVKTRKRAEEIQAELKAKLTEENFENVSHVVIQEEIKDLNGKVYRL